MVPPVAEHHTHRAEGSRVVRLDAENVAQVVERAHDLSHVDPGQRPAVEGRGAGWFQFESGREVLDRLFELPDPAQRQTPVMVGGGQTGVEFDGAPEVAHGPFLVSQCGKTAAPVQEEAGVGGVQGDGPVEVLNRAFEVAQRDPRRPPVVVRHGVVGRQGDGPVEVLHGEAVLPPPGAGEAPVVVRFAVAGREFDDPAEVVLRLARVTLFRMEQSPGRQGGDIVRVGSDEAIQEPERFLELLRCQFARQAAGVAGLLRRLASVLPGGFFLHGSPPRGAKCLGSRSVISSGGSCRGTHSSTCVR